MKTLKYVSLMFIAFVFIMGCAGNYGKFKMLTESESKLTQPELIDSWSDYDIWVVYRGAYKPSRLGVIIFDKKNDGRKILVGHNWNKVKDQEMWTEIVKENTTSDGVFNLVWYKGQNSTGVREIWGPNNLHYGFIIYQGITVELMNVKLVDENTIRLSWKRPAPVGQI